MKDNKRIEYIDLAKGFCIILVVLEHVARPLVGQDTSTSVFLNICGTFRMPLYFILSGIFFKDYSFKVFSIKKINNLLIPYLFMFVASNICDAALYYHDTGKISLIGGDYPKISSATWFLLCLFELNLLLWLSNRLVINKWLRLAFCLTLGICGSKVDIPYFLDVCLTSVPFFYIGTLLKPYIQGKKNAYYIERYWYVTLFVIFIIYCIYYPKGNVVPTNTIQTNIFLFYLYGVMGTIFILILSKKINYLPFFSYVGRYSIIVLCWHFALLYPLQYYLKNYIASSSVLILMLMCLIMFLMYYVIIPFVRRCLPYFFAQKNLIKLPNE